MQVKLWLCEKQSWSLVYLIDTIYRATNSNLPYPIYQTISTETNFSLGIKPNKIHETESTTQIHQAKCLKYREPNIPNQIFLIKATKVYTPNKIYQTKYTEN